MELEDIKGLLQFPKRIVILAHRNPDGDAIGSSLALRLFLIRIGHQVSVIYPTDYPPMFTYLEGIDTTLVHAAQREESEAAIRSAEMIFFLDFNGLDRIDQLGPLVQESEVPKVMIDHHLDPEPIADWDLSVPKASSTCELIYVFIEMLGKLDSIDIPLAECLFTGILTDTGSFRFSTNERVYKIAAHLKAIGVDDYTLQNRLFNSLTEKQLRLIGHCIANRMILMNEYQTGIFYLTREDFRNFQIQRGDTEGIVNYILMMRKMRVAIFVTDQNGNIKLSFRSKGNISVQDLAREYFGGGGHKNASGGSSRKTLNETVDQLKQILPAYLEEHGLVKQSIS